VSVLELGVELHADYGQTFRRCYMCGGLLCVSDPRRMQAHFHDKGDGACDTGAGYTLAQLLLGTQTATDGSD
jgi:hypothetical protein